MGTKYNAAARTAKMSWGRAVRLSKMMKASKTMKAGRKRDERLMIGAISLLSHTSSAVHFTGDIHCPHTHTHFLLTLGSRKKHTHTHKPRCVCVNEDEHLKKTTGTCQISCKPTDGLPPPVFTCGCKCCVSAKDAEQI